MSSDVATLAPGLLIAPPPLADPNFDRTVVLLAMHNAGGALGFVVNRAAPLTVGQLLVHAGYDAALATCGAPVLIGGPVQPSAAWTIWLDPDEAEPPDGVLSVGPSIRVASSREAFDRLAVELGAGEVRPRLVLLGYSGWGPQQLDGELAAGAWVPVAVDEDLVFEPDLDAKWERAYARSGLSAVGGINMRDRAEA
jgi:putative transcriptional regulator